MDDSQSPLTAYGENYQRIQEAKYRQRLQNHWKFRIELVHRLVEQYALPQIPWKPKNEIVVLDVGCSTGTFALEFSRLGYRSIGIDSDPMALESARRLAAEEKVSSEFVCGDICDWNADLPEVDIAVCFDIFEHLHDDQLGALLTALRKKFKRPGSLVFHTFPTQYNHIFWGRTWARYPLIPFKHVSPRTFAALTKAFSLLIDLGLLAARGKTFREQIKGSGHCNPTTGERLREILQRSGYEIALMETSNLYPAGDRHPDGFPLQPISHRNLYGVAVPKGG